MDDLIKEMPKVELHLHLDGSLDLDIANDIDKTKNKKEIKYLMEAPNKCKDLNEYLKRFTFPISIMQSKDNLIRLSKGMVDYLESQNVIYAEVRFAPNQHTKEGLTLDEVVESVLYGFKQNKNVKTNLILCMMRGDSYINNLNIISLAEKYLNKGVCAIDLAGAEGIYETSLYEDLFNIAKSKGIPYTIHAGEVRDAKEVETAINMGAKRIGHGIHSLNDEDTLRLIKNKNIVLELCPTSNIQTNAIDKYNKYPIKEFLKKGIKVCINTDNKTVSNISLNEEYIKLSHILGIDYTDFVKMNIYAIESSFISNKEKRELINKYKKYLDMEV